MRILRTCRELGIESVSVHSTADENSLHVKLADESVCIGPAKAKDSYLNQNAIFAAAEITGADAIHPGFGFLSENASFAAACSKWNVTFIGPTAKNIERLGDKIFSKKVAKRAGVPILEPIRAKNVSFKDVITYKQQTPAVAETKGYVQAFKAYVAQQGGKEAFMGEVEELIKDEILDMSFTYKNLK